MGVFVFVGSRLPVFVVGGLDAAEAPEEAGEVGPEALVLGEAEDEEEDGAHRGPGSTLG